MTYFAFHLHKVVLQEENNNQQQYYWICMLTPAVLKCEPQVYFKLGTRVD